MFVSNKNIPRLPRMSALNYHFGLKMRCYPSSKQKQMIDENSYLDRFLYNRDVAIHNAEYQFRKWQFQQLWQQLELPGLFFLKPRMIYFEPLILDWCFYKYMDSLFRDSQLTQIYPWINTKLIDSMVPKNVHKKYASALHLMKQIGNGWPNFHKKSYRLTYQTSCSYPGKTKTTLFTGSIRFLDINHLKLPKLGRIRVAGSQKRILDLANKNQLIRIGTVTICHHSDDTFTVSLQLGSNQPFVNVERQVKHRLEDLRLLGIDLNTKNFFTDSKGNVISNPRYYRRNLDKLTKLQHMLSRKMRINKREHRSFRKSKRYQRNRIAKAKLEQHIRNCRNDFTQQLSNNIIKNHDFIVTEKLQSKNMLKNHALAMSIQDVGWRSFINQLNYKAELYNKIVLQVDPKYTTQVCHNCSFRMGTCGSHKLTLADRKWTCPMCGNLNIRDYNASLNILARGIRDYLENVESVSDNLKQAKKQYLQHKYQLSSKMLGFRR